MAVARGGSMQRVQAWYAAVCGRLELLLGQLGAGGTSPRGVGRWRDGRARFWRSSLCCSRVRLLCAWLCIGVAMVCSFVRSCVVCVPTGVAPPTMIERTSRNMPRTVRPASRRWLVVWPKSEFLPRLHACATMQGSGTFAGLWVGARCRDRMAAGFAGASSEQRGCLNTKSTRKHAHMHTHTQPFMPDH